MPRPLRPSLEDSPFAILTRAFLAQLFTSESATSDTQLHQATILGLTFLLPPGIFLMVAVFPEFENVVLYHPALIDQARLRIALLLIMFAMVTIGCIAVYVWEGLTFERRDAMVIGPLPLRASTVIGAKVAALAMLLYGAALAINILTAVPFGAVVANHFGVAGFLRDGAALLATSIGAATFVFTSLVVTRALVTLLGTPRMAARLGSLLQFAFVAGILCFVTLLPALASLKREEFLAVAPASLNPASWFLGLYEYLHGSPESGFAILAGRATLALAGSLIGAIGLSIVSVQRQLQRALAPVASASALGRALISRTLAGWLLGRDVVARGTADFILLTIARNRAQQGPIAISAAIGLAMIVVAVSGIGGTNGRFWAVPATADLLRVPLVLAYWTAVGMRAAFFVPSELPAAWSFRTNALEATRSYWSATRAAMVAFVLPPTLAATALIGPLVGWRLLICHVPFVMVMTMLLAQLLTLTVSHIPFIRAYEPGHARLRTRWPIYLLGMTLFATVPTRIELRLLTAAPPSLAAMVAFVVVPLLLLVLLDAMGRRRARRWTVEEPEQSAADWERLNVLDLGPTPARALPR
jgi:hypothetical protein